MTCTCLLFLPCDECNKKFEKYINLRNKMLKKIQVKNKEKKICNCHNVLSYNIYVCIKCDKDLYNWYNDEYCIE